MERQKTGVPRIDELLDGGLTKGRITLVRGAKGVGIRHLGVSFALKRRGLVLDLSPNPTEFDHSSVAYAQRKWRLRPFVRGAERDTSDYLHVYQCLTDEGNIEGQISPGQYQLLCDKIVRNRVWIARFLHDGFSRGIQRLTIDGIQSLSTPFGSAQRSLLKKIFSEFIHVPPSKLLEATREVGVCDQYVPSDIGIMLIVETHSLYVGRLLQNKRFEWVSTLSEEELPVSLQMTSSASWHPRDWTTELRLGRIEGHSDFALSIPHHNLSSHSPGPQRYTIEKSSQTFSFKPWF